MTNTAEFEEFRRKHRHHESAAGHGVGLALVARHFQSFIVLFSFRRTLNKREAGMERRRPAPSPRA
jgi:hypothetical protein